VDRAIPALRTGPLPAALVADGANRPVAGSGAPRGRAFAVAALVHVAAILLFLLLPNLWRELPEPPPLIATLVLEPPPPPPPPAPEPPRPRQRPEPRARQSGAGDAPPTEKPAQKERASGADPEQAAAADPKPAEPSPPAPSPPAPEPAKPDPAPAEPAAAEAQPEPAKPSPPTPSALPEVAAVAPEPATVPPEPTPAPDAPLVPRQKPPPPAEASPRTALAAPHRPSTAPRRDADRDPSAEPGDRYLNTLRDRIERHRTYPAAARPLGLRGTAQYSLTIDRAGRILRLRLSRTSGMEVLDRTGEQMIRDAAPLPGMPPDIPGEALDIEIRLTLFPI
jgi:protein TonB